MDSVSLRFSYVGFASKLHSFINNKDSVLNIEMGNDLEIVEVEAERIERIEQSTQMSTVNMLVEQIKGIACTFRRSGCFKSNSAIARSAIWNRSR